MRPAERRATGALAQATGREKKASQRFDSDRTVSGWRAVSWAALAFALVVVVAADDTRPADGSMSAGWSGVARPAP